MNNLITDISTLTAIPEKTLNKILDKAYVAINDIILEDLMEDKKVAEIDIGIGSLYIQLLHNSIKYKFIPNATLEENVRNTIIHKTNLLENTLETNLVDKLTNTYKDFM